MEELFADVVIDISHEKVDRPFQYRVPEGLYGKVLIGTQVQIPFGKGDTLREGYVIELKHTPDYPPEKIKEIRAVYQDAMHLDRVSIQLAYWMKRHYGSTMIQALKTVLPVKQAKKAVITKEVSLIIPKDQANELMIQAQNKKQHKKARLLEALLESSSVSYSLLTGSLAISPQTIMSLEKNLVLRIDSYESYRVPFHFDEEERQSKQALLTHEQQAIVDDFLKAYDEGDLKPALLYGITGSGKTEVYMELIQGILDRGKQAIVLIPEIALTYQTLLRFYKRFGDIVSCVNSKLSPAEKYDQFQRAKNGEVKIMIGPRTALFTPFQNLGIVILDEEHEQSYKSENMPRYHARETAIALCEITKAKVMMGSATPSVNAYYKANQGEYTLYTLKNRIGEAKLAGVEVVDLRKELREGNRTIFSKVLQEKIQDRLDKKEQIMLFLNRRGMAGFVSCRSCGHVMTCPHCDVSLSDHKTKMVCHYCGYEIPSVKKCPECGSPHIFGFKAGTQQVEENIQKLYPQARVLRMDADTTKKKDDYEQILQAFANEEADILIGTQMIVKGHDFKKVTLVGVLAADLSLFNADYKSGEKTFQLLTQAVGRAGRHDLEGLAYIQTYQPEHYAVMLSAEQNYEAFYEQEILYRKLMQYPPCAHMLAILVNSKQEKLAKGYSEQIKKVLEYYNKEEKSLMLIGPAPASVGKVNDIYRYLLYVKSPREEDLILAKDRLEAYFKKIESQMKWVSVYFDFDPMNAF